jgi:hypothetical protein
MLTVLERGALRALGAARFVLEQWLWWLASVGFGTIFQELSTL